MNAYEYSILAGITGTDQEIVNQLVASGVTARAIDLDELLYTLNLRGMLVKLAIPGESGERWTGSVMAMIAAVNAAGTDQQKMQLSIWFSHITNPRNLTWNTTQPQHAATFWQLKNTFANQPTMPTSADFEAIAGLGGGWLFAGLTVEQFTSLRLASQLKQTKSQLLSDATDAFQTFKEQLNAWDGTGNAPVLGA